jgi:indole-3-glycerol phosphate synthase
VNAVRRLSQAISEGDGISLLVPVDDAETARKAEAEGAEGLVVGRELAGLREASGLPVLCQIEGPAAAVEVGADACLLRVETAGDGTSLADLHAQAEELGIEPVIGVRNDEELEFALEQVDPEIVLLSAVAEEDDGDPLERVLDLLPDVPAGKLAIADVVVHTREDVVALETAGVDAVIVRPGDVARLVGGAPPEV